MVRRLKPEDKLTKDGKKAREYFKKNPERREDFLKRSKKYYQENKLKIRIRKKLKTKSQREEVIKKLGSKCASCGDLYNRHLTRSNLELDHKFYMKGESKPGEVFRQVLNQIENG